jgi:hypothetical protein
MIDSANYRIYFGVFGTFPLVIIGEAHLMNKIKLRKCRGLRRRFPSGLVIDRNEKPAGRILFNQTPSIRLLNEPT